MDEFDIIDMLCNHVMAADTGMTVYKDSSIIGETENHIVIYDGGYYENDWENHLVAYIYIFIKSSAQSGMPNRSLMRETKRKVRAELLKIKPEKGKYQSIELSVCKGIGNLKEGFHNKTIELIINVEKNIEDYGY